MGRTDREKDPEPALLARISDAARLEGMMPYLEDEVSRMNDALETRIYAKIDHNELSADEALTAWLEKRTYAKLVRRLRSKVKLDFSEDEQKSLDFASHPPILA